MGGAYSRNSRNRRCIHDIERRKEKAATITAQMEIECARHGSYDGRRRSEEGGGRCEDVRIDKHTTIERGGWRGVRGGEGGEV